MKRIPNGSVVYKCGSKTGDSHQDGDAAIVISSIGPIQFGGDPEAYGYMVRWNDMQDVEVFIAGFRITDERSADEREYSS